MLDMSELKIKSLPLWLDRKHLQSSSSHISSSTLVLTTEIYENILINLSLSVFTFVSLYQSEKCKEFTGLCTGHSSSKFNEITYLFLHLLTHKVGNLGGKEKRTVLM